MIKDNVILVRPLGSLTEPSGYMRTCYLGPITLEYLAAATESSGYVPYLLTKEVTSQEIINSIKNTKPFVIGFSVYTYTYDECLSLARIAKQKAKELGYNVSVVFGGYHPTVFPESTLENPEVDVVVIGEGEATFSELLNVLNSKGDLGEIAGIAYKKNGEIIRTVPRERIKNLDSLPLPKRYPEHLELGKQFQITYPPPSEQVGVAQVTYSRGCPFSCSFCASESTWGRQVFWRSPKKVLDEIEILIEKFGTNLVYFPDLTFNAGREKVFDICSEFKKRKLPVHWWALFRSDLLDEELLEALVSANCVKISLGLESLDDNTAQTVKGDYNTKFHDLKNTLQLADNLGIIIKAFLIIGFPTDTEALIQAYKESLLKLPIDELRVTFATPFPGTRFWDQCIKDNLISSKPCWNKFTTEEPVLKHPCMSNEKLLNLRSELVNDFYLDLAYLNHTNSKIKRFPHLRKSWLEYFEFLQNKNVFKNNVEDSQRLLNVCMGHTEN